MRWILGTLALVLALIALAEVGVRYSGLVDFPLYDADSRIGYIPQSNQAGVFGNINSWAFNDKHMGTSRRFQPRDGDILLVGDSLVLGGNTYREYERLGPQLEAATGRLVWPIGAGSWALQNELQYLIDNPDVSRSVSRIIIVSNPGDFGLPSSWASELTHPRSRPKSALWYVFEKYIFDPFSPRPVPAEKAVPQRSYKQLFETLRTTTSKPIDIFFYADKAQFSAGTTCQTQPLMQLNLPPAAIHCLTGDPSWSLGDYKDEIHPTPSGMTKLATIMADELPRAPDHPEVVVSEGKSSPGH